MITQISTSGLLYTGLNSLAKAMTAPAGRPELTIAQFAAFQKQVPLLYATLLINTLVLAIAYLRVAPVALAISFPLVLSTVCIVRLIQWQRSRGSNGSLEQAAGALTRTKWLSAILSCSFAVWGYSLFPYGTEVMQSHIAFYIAITVMACIFCLTHLRAAAVMVAAIVNTSFVIFFVSTGHPTFVALSVNVVLVSIAMLLMVLGNYRDFNALVESRRVLEAAQAKTQALSDENFRLANLDSLTELQNRRSFFSTLDAAVEAASRDGRNVAVGVLDLDGFKPINDTYGHPMGDILLRRIADRLSVQCGSDVSIFRIGGDEFAMIFEAQDVSDVLEHAYDMCVVLREPFRLPACTARISGTIGLALYPQMAANSVELFERADYAMYRAKRATGRGEAWLFSASDEAEIKRSSVIEQTLKTADLEAELSLQFQPIVDVLSGRTVSFEALARWKSPVLGQVSPGEFIPTAERAGFISNLTRVLFKKALDTAAQWPDDVRLSFNLSVFDISSPENLSCLTSLITASTVAPHRIDLEITETAMISDFAAIMEAIDSLKRFGVGISLDDFGTGYSSLRQVHQLPLDKLKVDRSFVTNIHINQSSQQIVKSLISLCKDLKLTCVVEGVESTEELEALQKLGCELVQGYYYGKPMEAALIDGHLARSTIPAARHAG